MSDTTKIPARSSVLATGYTCTCGHFNIYPGYVYAHWRSVFHHRCENCDRPWRIVCGDARPARKRKTDK